MICFSCNRPIQGGEIAPAKSHFVNSGDGSILLKHTHRGCRFVKKEALIKRRVDPERIISEYGATELSKTKDGVRVLEAARKKYRAELVQPGDPEFKKLYGKQHKEQAELRRHNEDVAKKMWEQRGGKEKINEGRV